MKFIYTTQYAEVATARPGSFGEVQYVQVPCGGSFIAEDEKTEIQLTPYSVIQKYRDHQADMLNQMAGYFGNVRPSDSGYIGKWSPELEKEANIYYFIQDNMIHSMIITKFSGMSFTNIGGIEYIIEYQNKMMDSIPEENDIIYDNKEEALQTIIKSNK